MLGLLRVFGLTMIALACILLLGMATGRGICASKPSANGRPREFTFNGQRYSQLAVQSSDLERLIQWPSQEAFRDTHQLARKAQPIPLVRGHLAVIHGREIVDQLGKTPSWEQVLALLPEARKRAAAQQEQIEQTISDQAGETQRSQAVEPLAEDWLWAQECRDVLLAFWKDGERWKGFDMRGYDCQASPVLLPLEPLRENPDEPLVEVSDSTVVAFQPAARYKEYDLDPDLWEAWTYSTTLLNLKRPLYEIVYEPPRTRISEKEFEKRRKRQEALEEKLREAMKAGSVEGLAAIDEALESGIDPQSRVLDEAARFAEQEGNLELALRVRTRFRPIGFCSMDTAPQKAARSYADLCFKTGDLACFLNLQVRIMGDSFRRAVYSSYGEAAHETEASRLQQTGIDLRRFLEGLAVQYVVEGKKRVEIGPWRLARSSIEAGVAKEMEGFFEELAANPGADPYNRLRGTMALAYLSYQQQPEPSDKDSARRAWAAAFQRLRGIPLTKEARLWINYRILESDE